MTGRAKRWARAALVAGIATAMPLTTNVGMGSAAAPADAKADAPIPSGTYYALTDPACAPAGPGQATCFAVRRELVPKGTTGSTPFTVSASYPVGPSGGYTPDDLRTAYGLTGLPSSAGGGQTVAVVDAYDDPNALADLNHFDAQYGLPDETSASFEKLNQSGIEGSYPSASTGWSGEASLDVQIVRGICHTCRILLVEANDAYTSDLGAAVNAAVAAGATEISNSYGGSETGVSSTIFNDYNHPGVVITASTGDNGWDGWDLINNAGGTSQNQPAFPSTSPDVVAVGGTALTLNSDGTRNTEAVWDEDGPENSWVHEDATGGGCSTAYTAQAWQADIAGFANTGCGTSRLAADVSALADPYTGFDVYNSYDGSGWLTYGGTSLASPLVAAMWALAGGAQGVSYPALTLYGNAADATPAFYDVTKGYQAGHGVVAVGGNDWCAGDPATTCSAKTSGGNPNGTGKGMLSCLFTSAGAVQSNVNQCTAASGFDGPSGIGTPIGIAPFSPRTPTPSFTAPTGVLPDVATGFSGSASDPLPGGTITSYSWNWGDGSTASTGASPTHTFTASGTYTVTLTATDNYGQVGTVSQTIGVGSLAPVVASISPNAGAPAGGGSVTITGSGFTGASKVQFGGGTAGAVFTVNSDSSITATVPAHAAGVVNVFVTTPVGVSAAVAADRYTYAT
ncbi:MAG TPA: PKD domain-containing protein, partial [Mycobacteriales bacterium]|nr:PKD domain-containing protein [Mycobacteriales bacterium]